jgi:hypothetical protein
VPGIPVCRWRFDFGLAIQQAPQSFTDLVEPALSGFTHGRLLYDPNHARADRTTRVMDLLSLSDAGTPQGHLF